MISKTEYMSFSSFRPVAAEETFVTRPVPRSTTPMGAGYASRVIANNKEERSKGFFMAAIEKVMNLFSKEVEHYSNEEIEEMITSFRRAIMYLQEKKIQGKRTQ